MSGRSPTQLEQTWTARDLAEATEFERRYDLPDGFFVAGRVCAAIFSALSGTAAPYADFVPYYRAALDDFDAQATDADDNATLAEEAAANRAALALTLDPIRQET